VARSLDTDAVARALTRVYGDGVVVSDARRVTGGASRETWLFDATVPDGATKHRVERLVLRRDPGALAGQTGRETEYHLLAAARAAGVEVPEVVVLLQAADELGAGFVMQRVDGETIPRKLLRDDDYAAARPQLARQLGAIAARIHAVPTATLPPLPVLDGAAQVTQFRDYLDGFGDPHPALELGFRWLAAHAPPPPAAPALVHGDYRNGNVIVGLEGVRAVLDWELAHLGDPLEDLGWLCVRAWRFGQVDKVVAGFGGIDELLDGYEAAGGTRPMVEALRWWVALGTVKWAVMCKVQAATHLDGHVRSVELATIGRRVAENEHDLLVLLDGGW
jgi:aminoglycoside phosphotransferase (APT) family kinase protein